MRTHQLIVMAALLAAAVLIAGCTTDRIHIAKILNNPDHYLNKDVTIAGEITKTYKVNLVIAETGAYQVDDGTGKIWVVTRSSVPEEGTKVGLIGTVTNKIEFLELPLGVIIQEKDRRTRE